VSPAPTREQIGLWLAQGARDLEIAESNHEQGFHDACAFYCEQGVEMYLKALYMALNQVEAPKTHRLIWFAHELALGQEFLSGLHDLERDYMVTRYPDVGVTVDGRQYAAETAADRLDWARRIRDWVTDRMPGQPKEGDSDAGDNCGGTAPEAA